MGFFGALFGGDGRLQKVIAARLGSREAGVVPRVDTIAEPDALSRPLVDGFELTLSQAVKPGKLKRLHAEDAVALGQSPEQLWDIVLAGLPAAAPVEVEPRLFEVDAATAIAGWGRFEAPVVHGEPVLVFLGDDVPALLTGSLEREGLRAAARRVVERIGHDKKLVGVTLVRRDGAWQRWLPPEREVLRAALIMLRRVSLSNEYERQRGRLQLDRFIARYRADRSKGMAPLSVSSWAKGVPTLLPRTEAIVLGETLTQGRVIDFEDALKHLGHHMHPMPGLSPPRWLVDTFPSAEELAATPEYAQRPYDWFEDAPASSVSVAPVVGMPAEAEFAREALAVLSELGARDIEYIVKGFGVRIAMPAGTPMPPGAPADATVFQQLGFRTPYSRFAVLPAEARRASLRSYFAAVLNVSAERQSRSALLPLMRPADEHWRSRLQLKLQFGGAPVEVPNQVLRTFLPGISIGFVVDAEKTVRGIHESDLEGLGMTAAGLFEVAVQNLDARTPRPLMRLSEGVYASPYADDYDATRLLLPRLLEGLELKGRPVAFVPVRNALIVTGSEDERGLLDAHARVRLALKTDSRPVHLAPLMLTEQGFEPWLPSRRSAAHAAVQELINSQLADELERGAKLLRGLNPGAQVAKLATQLHATDARIRVAVLLPEAADVLVPRADVVFTAGKRELSWEEFTRTHAVTPVEGAAERWWRLRT